MFLEESEIEELWRDENHRDTILGSLYPLIGSQGDIREANAIKIERGLDLIAGDSGLSSFEDLSSEAWSKCLDSNAAVAGDGFRVVTAFHRVIARSAENRDADLVLIDVGPNIGAMNRAALIAADFVVIPIEADLFSVQSLGNLGTTLRGWRIGWETRRRGRMPLGLLMPSGQMKPLGYVLLNPSVRENQPVKSYLKWAKRIPGIYAKDVLGEERDPTSIDDDPNQLAMLKHFKSLMPMAQDARTNGSRWRDRRPCRRCSGLQTAV
jgi:cellulose biosynthesis protein BcsQ